MLEYGVMVVPGSDDYVFLFIVFVVFLFFGLVLCRACSLAFSKWLPFAACGSKDKVGRVDMLRNGKVPSTLAVNGGWAVLRFCALIAYEEVGEGADWGWCRELI